MALISQTEAKNLLAIREILFRQMGKDFDASGESLFGPLLRLATNQVTEAISCAARDDMSPEEVKKEYKQVTALKYRIDLDPKTSALNRSYGLMFCDLAQTVLKPTRLKTFHLNKLLTPSQQQELADLYFTRNFMRQGGMEQGMSGFSR